MAIVQIQETITTSSGKVSKKVMIRRLEEKENICHWKNCLANDFLSTHLQTLYYPYFAG
jgi:hypothetical protein